MNAEIVDSHSLKPAPWGTASHILTPDFRLLRQSMERYGWLQPLTCRASDRTIIDGTHRWMIANKDRHLGASTPVVWVDCDDTDAMLLHLQLNRGRGELLNKDVSKVMKAIIRGQKYDETELREMLRMSSDEFDVLADGTLVKMRNVKRHEYSRGWVPVEVAAAPENPITIERPPNKDS